MPELATTWEAAAEAALARGEVRLARLSVEQALEHAESPAERERIVSKMLAMADAAIEARSGTKVETLADVVGAVNRGFDSIDATFDDVADELDELRQRLAALEEVAHA